MWSNIKVQHLSPRPPNQKVFPHTLLATGGASEGEGATPPLTERIGKPDKTMEK